MFDLLLDVVLYASVFILVLELSRLLLIHLHETNVKKAATHYYKVEDLELPDNYVEDVAAGLYDNSELQKITLFMIFQICEKENVKSEEIYMVFKNLRTMGVDERYFFGQSEEPAKVQIGKYIKQYEKYLQSRQEGCVEIESFAKSQEIGNNKEGGVSDD